VSDKHTNILFQTLSNIGLDDFTIRFYEHLLLDSKNQEYLPTTGQVKMKINILNLAVIFGVQRNVIYTALEKLHLEGLIDYLGAAKNVFVLNSIEVIKAKLLAKEAETKRLANSFDEFLPDIMGKYSSLSKKSYVNKFEGSNSFIYYINQLIPKLEKHSDVLVFGEGENFYNNNLFPFLLNVWQVGRVARAVNIKILLQQNNSTFLPFIERNKRDLRQTKFLAKDVDARGAFWLVNNELIHFDTALDRVIAIEDKSLVKLHTQLFEQVWGVTSVR
jgi:hypothetical protein